MTTAFSFDLSFGQLAVFASSLDKPFNDWSDRHVAQGFAWRPGSVSFRSIIDSGVHSVELRVQERVGTIDANTVRAIEVPFEAPADGMIEVGSVGETIPIALPPGSYLLRCEFLTNSGLSAQRVHLTFASKEPSRFAVVVGDEQLSGFEVLLTTAEPAE